jgi:autonomous glycyl radical cofactor GrcA
MLKLLIDDLIGGAQALSEVEFLAFCRRHGFPRPKCQARLDSLGRRRYLDAELRSRTGRIVRIEIDGGVHLKLEIRARDTIKDNDAHIDGKLVLRYTSYSIYTNDPDAVRQIRRTLDD